MSDNVAFCRLQSSIGALIGIDLTGNMIFEWLEIFVEVQTEITEKVPRDRKIMNKTAWVPHGLCLSEGNVELERSRASRQRKPDATT